MFKKCRVVILPTNKKALILKNLTDGRLLELETPLKTLTNLVKGQNLYIISNEEPEHCQWVLDVKSKKLIYWDKKFNWKKDIEYPIIATTDFTFEKELPLPSKSFIKKYCELGGTDEIMVECNQEEILMIDPPEGWRYGFPKQVPGSLEHLSNTEICSILGYPTKNISSYGNYFSCRYWKQEINTVKVRENNTIIIKPIKNSWNKEEILKLFFEFAEEVDKKYRPFTSDNEQAVNYLEEFKNKI